MKRKKKKWNKRPREFSSISFLRRLLLQILFVLYSSVGRVMYCSILLLLFKHKCLLSCKLIVHSWRFFSLLRRSEGMGRCDFILQTLKPWTTSWKNNFWCSSILYYIWAIMTLNMWNILWWSIHKNQESKYTKLVQSIVLTNDIWSLTSLKTFVYHFI